MTNEQTNSSEALYRGYTSEMGASSIDNGTNSPGGNIAGFRGDGRVIGELSSMWPIEAIVGLSTGFFCTHNKPI